MSSQLGGAETALSRRAKGVDDALDQRRLRADDGQVHSLVLGEAQQFRDSVGRDGDILQLGFQRRAGIARRDVDSANFWGLCGFPRQRVFAAAAADD